MININFLPWNRVNFLEFNISQLIKLDDNIKKIIKVSFHNSGESEISRYIEILNQHNIVSENCLYAPGFNYTQKVNSASSSDYEYSISCDEDCLCPTYSWKQLIESRNLLNDKVCCIIPNISNVIPSFDEFLDSNFNNLKEKYYTLLKEVNFGHLWGVNYHNLNGWNDIDDFYNRVKVIDHFYKGIHPIRLSRNVQIELLKDISEKLETILTPKEFEIKECIRPYMCNNMFIMKTSEWNDAIKKFSRDPFDEVSINIYREHNNKKYFIIKSANVIHPFYNIFDDAVELANIFYDKYIKPLV